jgi:hypothetical protein
VSVNTIAAPQVIRRTAAASRRVLEDGSPLMRPLTQPPTSIQYDDPTVDFHIEDVGRQPAWNPTPLQVEMDGIREAIRLNWLEMERLELSHADRRAICVNVARLVHILAGLLALSRDERTNLAHLRPKTMF